MPTIMPASETDGHLAPVESLQGILLMLYLAAVGGTGAASVFGASFGVSVGAGSGAGGFWQKMQVLH